MREQTFVRDFENKLQGMIRSQLAESRTEFDEWFNALDLKTSELFKDIPAPLLEMARDATRKMCWNGWFAREPHIALFKLQTEASRKLCEDFDKLQAECNRLKKENQTLRNTIDNVLAD